MMVTGNSYLAIFTLQVTLLKVTAHAAIVHLSPFPILCYYRLHGEDNVAIKRYVISFWNGVDLRYKLLQGPSVKISIAGIIISRVSACSYSLNFLL